LLFLGLGLGMRMKMGMEKISPLIELEKIFLRILFDQILFLFLLER